MEKFTVEQISNMLHTVGGKITVNKKPTRNYFNTGRPDPQWDELCDKGYALAFISMDQQYYKLTQKGIDLLRYLN